MHRDCHLEGKLISCVGGISVVVAGSLGIASMLHYRQLTNPDDVPAWARSHVELALDSAAGVTHILARDGIVVINQSNTTEAVEETSDSPGTEANVERMYTVVTNKCADVHAPFKAVGDIVDEIELCVLGDGTSYVVLKRLMNGKLLVVPAGAAANDHIVIDAAEMTARETTMARGVIREFLVTSTSHAAYLVEVGSCAFWVPVVLLVAVAYTSPVASSQRLGESEEKFGQVGGDFYIRDAAGRRLHIATALKIYQPWIDHASHNRSERFRVKRKAVDGDLVPLNYYARCVQTGPLAGIAFRISCLGKLCKVAPGYSTHLHSAAYDAADINVQWTDYERNQDGLHVRCARQNLQELLATSPMHVAMKVELDESLEISGGTLTSASQAALLQAGLVDETHAAHVRELQLVLPKRATRDAPAPPPPFSVNGNRVISHIRDDCVFAGDAPADGDVLLSVDSSPCQGTHASVVGALREAVAREHAKCERASADRGAMASNEGGRVLFCVWTPPQGWAPPTPPTVTDGAADDAYAVAEALPEYIEEDMKCLIRLCSRLIGGSKDRKNLTAMCHALSLPSTGSLLVLQRRIEHDLRKRNFQELDFTAADRKGDERALPSHADVSDRTNEQLSAKFEGTVFRLPQIAHLLLGLSRDSTGEPAARSRSQQQPEITTFADQELTALSKDNQIDVSFQPHNRATMLQLTASTMSHTERQKHVCYENITLKLPGQQPRDLQRGRELSEDWCPVFEHDEFEQLVRFRINDISVDSDDTTWLHGFWLYSKAQLPTQARNIRLLVDFDDSRELVESVDQVSVPAVELRGLVRVLSSEQWRKAGKPNGACHQEAAFVEEFDDIRKWKTAQPTQRPLALAATGPTAAGSRLRGGAGRSGT